MYIVECYVSEDAGQGAPSDGSLVEHTCKLCCYHNKINNGGVCNLHFSIVQNCAKDHFHFLHWPSTTPHNVDEGNCMKKHYSCRSTEST